MYNLSDIDTIKKILESHGFSFSKALGQNFLINSSVCPEMAELSGIDSDSGVIEIGAGIGVLTTELAKRAKKVISFELDKRLIPVLSETLAEHKNVKIINADIMTADLHKLIDEEFCGTDVYVCANLPYYITSPVIMMLLKERLPLKTITVMVQKEAGDRICAQVGTRNAGPITVAVNYYSTAEKLFDVPAESFFPSPKVDSCVVRLELRSEPPISVDEEKFDKLVRAAFSQRRKTAANSISSGLSISKEKVYEVLRELNLPENVRAEALSMNELEKVCNMI